MRRILASVSLVLMLLFALAPPVLAAGIEPGIDITQTLAEVYEAVRDPRQGIPIQIALAFANGLLGAILARRAGEFDRRYVWNWFGTRVMNQVLPVTLFGLAAIYLTKPPILSHLLSAIYVACAFGLVLDLGADLTDKLRRWRSSGTDRQAA